MKITKRLFSLLLALLLVAPVLQVPSYAADLGSTAPQVENENTLSEVELQGINSVPKMTTESIISVAAGAGDHCLTFYSATAFSLRKNARCTYDGDLQCLQGNPAESGWEVWSETNQEAAIAATLYNGAYYVSIRGDDNVYVNGPTTDSFAFDNCFDTYGYSTGEIYCEGDVNYILSYDREETDSITCAYALGGLFTNFQNLVTAPTTKASELGTGAFYRLFYYCIGLRQAPDIEANILGQKALSNMFCYCTFATPPIIAATVYYAGAMEKTFTSNQSLLYPADINSHATLDSSVTSADPALNGTYLACRNLYVFKTPTVHNDHPYDRPWYYPFQYDDVTDTDIYVNARKPFFNTGTPDLALESETMYYIYNTNTTKTITYTVNDKAVYNPNGVIPEINITDPEGGAGATIEYSLDDGVNWLTADQLKQFTKEPKDYPIYFRISADGYEDAISIVQLKVRKEIQAPDVANVVATYDGSPKNATISVTEPSGAYTIQYSEDGTTYSNTPITVIDANDEPKTVYYKIIPNDSTQYFEKTGTYTIKVNKSDMNISADEIEYTGEVQPIVLKAKDANTNNEIDYVSFEYKTSPEGDYTSIVPTVKDEGDYTIYYRASAGSNYNVKEGQLTVNISSLPVIAGEFRISDSFDYDGMPHSITATPTNPSDALVEYSDDGINYTSTTAPTFTEPGVYERYYRVSKEGYKTKVYNYTITINKLPTSSWVIEASNPRIKNNGLAFDPTNANNITITTPAEGYSEIVYSISGENFENEFIAPTEIGEHRIYFKVSHPHYEDYIGSYTLIITDNEMVDAIPIYILYNPNSGEHLLTSKENEYNKLGNNGWKKEGISFYAYDRPVVGGTPIYRIFNPKHPGGDHHYTKSVGEANKRISEGWRWDFGGKPVFYGLGDVTVYKLYNKYGNFRHHYTRKKGEYDKLGKLGWIQEGVAWMAAKEGDQAEVQED